MGSEQFCLKWNDFHSNITSAFAEIREEDDFLDVTLVCDGDLVKAHKLVLSACSPLFRIMLKKNTHPNPMIFLKGIRYQDMMAILSFMYNGEVNVNQEDLQMFLAAAEELRIKGLSQTSSDGVTAKSKKALANAHRNDSPSRSENGHLGSAGGQPPHKRPRPDSSPASPISSPHSAKSPNNPDIEEEEEQMELPQLSVKREFSMNKVNNTNQCNNRDKGYNNESDEENDIGSNLLDCLVQAQNFALQQSYDQNLSQQMLTGNGQAGASAGGASGKSSGNDQNKNLLQFLGQNNVGNAAANALMMQRLLGTGYELHPLGSRKDDDPLAHIKVARSSKGWHCPQCIHISSTKGNLKSHILSGRHKTYTEKPFGCQYCDRSYGTKQSLQVHISTNHRAERDAEYQALSKSLGMKSFPDAQYYMKHENYADGVMSPAAIQQLQHQLQQAQVTGSQGGSEQGASGSSQAHMQATLASLSNHPNLTVQATLGERESLPSCRLEARGERSNSTVMEAMQNKVKEQFITPTMEESEDEDEEPPLAISMDSVNTSITTP